VWNSTKIIVLWYYSIIIILLKQLYMHGLLGKIKKVVNL